MIATPIGIKQGNKLAKDGQDILMPLLFDEIILTDELGSPEWANPSKRLINPLNNNKVNGHYTTLDDREFRKVDRFRMMEVYLGTDEMMKKFWKDNNELVSKMTKQNQKPVVLYDFIFYNCLEEKFGVAVHRWFAKQIQSSTLWNTSFQKAQTESSIPLIQ